MKITNKFGLPETIVKAMTADHHLSAGDISVSQLIDAPQIRVLKRKHRNEITQDVSEMVAALLGTGIHAILEKVDDDRLTRSFTDVRNYLISKKNLVVGEEADKIMEMINTIDGFSDEVAPDRGRYIVEKTLTVEVDGVILSGTFDLFDKTIKRLQDYKTTSTFSFNSEDTKKKWTAQQNVYAWMMRENGYEVDEASIVGIFKDWSRGKMFSNKDYPEVPILEMPLILYPHEKMGEYVRKRIALHKGAEAGNIPDCTGEERWSRADTYAVKKVGLKRALKVFSDEKSAEKFIFENEDKYDKPIKIEYRPGEDKRCNEFCAVNEFCEQYKRNKK